MLSRKEHPRPGIPLPLEWKESVVKSLNESYLDDCKREGKEFAVWGFLYETELLLIVSFLDSKNPVSLPISCFISKDVDPEGKGKMDKALPRMLDVCTLVFDRVFNESDWDGYTAFWEEIDFKKEIFYLQINRENIALSLEADALLGE